MKDNTKRNIILVIAVIILMWFCFCVIDRIVVRKGQVESVKGEVVTIVTNCGTAWEWGEEKGESFKTGDKVKLVMDNKGTLNILEDDVILKIVVDK